MKTIGDSFLFPSLVVAGGYFILAISIFFFVNAYWLAGGILLILSVIMAFSRQGLQFDKANHRVRRYSSVFFICTGTWLMVEDYPDMAVLKRTIRVRRGIGHALGTSSVERYFDIYLLSANHLKRVAIIRKETKEQADTEAQYLSRELGVNYTFFNPRNSRSSHRR